jgi:streptogramin lyase
MQGMNRTIARRVLIGVLVLAAMFPAAGAAGTPASKLKGTWTRYFPEYVHGDSVAIGPDGAPWFGVSVQGKGPSLAQVKSGEPAIEELGEKQSYAETLSLQFDAQGNLWFAVDINSVGAIWRRDPSGTLTEFSLPPGPAVTALAIGPEGDVWFTRSNDYGERSEAVVGKMSPAGAVTQFPLEPGSRPSSIAVDPDGALWFSETQASKIGRITTSGEVQVFALAARVQPRQIVAGADGALWFGENGQARRYGRVSDRIGRITAGGQVSQFAVPFGKGATRLAADPRGVIWFATEEGEFSSISPSGNVGPRGCVGSCGDPIESLTLAPDGALWFAAGHSFCEVCGGGSDLIINAEGTEVGEIPGGALSPADPNGPPAVDPYAKQTDHPPPPIARTEKPREVEGEFAELSGYINSRGFPTTWLFRWGKTKNYGHRSFLPEDPFRAEEGAGRIGEEIFGLCPSTTYHYEIVAFGSGGRTLGGDRSFMTPSQKHIPKHCLSH